MHAFRKLWNKIKHFSCGWTAVISIAMICLGIGYRIAFIRYNAELVVIAPIFKEIIRERKYNWSSSIQSYDLMEPLELDTRSSDNIGKFNVYFMPPYIEISRLYKVVFPEDINKSELFNVINSIHITRGIGDVVLISEEPRVAVLRIRYHTIATVLAMKEFLPAILQNFNGTCEYLKVALKDRFNYTEFFQLPEIPQTEPSSFPVSPVPAPAEFLIPVTPSTR